MTDPAQPLVSVAMRTFEHAPFVAQAIESVLIQRTNFPFELVIGEDCSPDGTREIVKAYAERHPQLIRTVLPEENVGHGPIFERVLEATRGRFIAYLDGDDYWTTTAKLRKQVDYLEANRDCVSCFHDVSLVYDAVGMPSGAANPGLAEAKFGLDDILGECFVGAPSMVFRRELAEDLPPWAFESAWIDWLMHIYAARKGPLGYLPEPMAAYRVHSGGMFSALDRAGQLEEDLRFYRRLLPEMPSQREQIERGMRYRRCQLAIERLGVPFEACVVLVDPRRELKPYFNGRHARSLPRRRGREVTELEAIRGAVRDLAPADRHYGAADVSSGDPGCYVVVPADARDWLGEQDGGFREYLEAHGRQVWEDSSVTVYVLPPLEGGPDQSTRPSRRVETIVAKPLPEQIAGANLEAPVAAASLPAHSISVSGWILGRSTAVAAFELDLDGQVLWRAPVNLPRPDIERGFPELTVTTPGFSTTVNALEFPDGAGVDAVAVMADGERLPFAQLHFRSEPGE